MDWDDGPPLDKPVVDWNEKFRNELKGDLEENVAAATLGKFLMHNIGFMIEIVTGFKLKPLQRILIKGWLAKNYSLTIASRGLGKSFLVSHFCYLYCLMNPGKHIVMVAPTFRSSRKILENIDGWSQRRSRPELGDPGGKLLRDTFAKDMEKKQDMYKITFKNGSTIVALPLGDPDRLRGFRCSVLIIDEGLMIAQTTIDTVLKPFLFAVPEEESIRRSRIRAKEDILIKEGKMKQEERAIFESQSKMIIISSASYAWQDLYALFKRYLKIIAQDQETIAELSTDANAKHNLDGKSATYLVHQLSYKLAEKDFVDKAAREEIESGMYSESTVKREFEAQFVQDSDGYYSAKKMDACTIENGKYPCVEIVGEKGAEYILGIDQAMSDSETSDHFAMCVIKIVEREKADGTKSKVGLVVHQYAEAGVDLREHTNYLLYILKRFNIVYVIYDATGGKMMSFISVCNESPAFRDNKIELKHIEGDFAKQDITDLSAQVRQGYNRADLRIVHPQVFNTDFLRASNDYMQACFDRRNLLFASKALAHPTAMQTLREQDVGDVIRTHPSFYNKKIPGERGNMEDFITQQDTLIDLVKRECALIEVTATPLGQLVFNLPQNMRRGTKKRNRVRRDSYTALLLANWGLKVYLESLNVEIKEYGEVFKFSWL